MLYRFIKNWRIETESLILWTPVVFAIGCLIYFLMLVEPSLYWGVSGLGIGCIGCFIIRRYYNAYLGYYQIFCCIFLISAGFCLSLWQTHRQEPFYSVPFYATIIQGKIKSVEYLSSGKRRVALQDFYFVTAPESDQNKWQRLVLFTLSKKDHQIIQNGYEIQAKVMLHRPFSPQFIGGYDAQFQAWFKNIGAYGYALEPIKIITTQPAYSIQNLREKIAARIRVMTSGASGAIAQILLTGIGGELSPNIRHVFAASGLAHLLAIAGLHLGIVMVIVTVTVRWLLLHSQVLTLYWPIKKIAIIVGWSVGCFYLVLTGLHSPAMRSLLMASIIMLALLSNRTVFSKYNLMLAALFLLLLSPASVLDVSFQMSMVAVIALVSGYQLIYQWPERDKAYDSYLYRFVKVYVLEAAWISLLAGTAIIPVVIYYFHELNIYFIFANLIAVPLMAIWIMPLGLLALFTMPLGFEYIFLKLMTIGIDWVTGLAEWISYLPYASISISTFPSWGYVLYCLGLSILCLCVTSIRWIGMVMMILGIGSIFLVTLPDMVTAPNGRMVGIKDDHRLFIVCQDGCDLTTIESWRKALNIMQVKIIAREEKGDGFECSKEYCLFDRKKILVTFNSFQGKEENSNICKSNILEFSFLWSGGMCKNIPIINKKSNWIQGAHSIWLRPLKVITDLEKRGQRPWVFEPIQRGIPNMPMAQQE